MVRSFRVYQKKRGHRRTGSRWLGNVGETLFFATLFLMGCVGLVALFLTLVVPAWRVNNEFVEHRCMVLDKRIEEKTGANGPAYRPALKVKYQVRNVVYVEWVYDIGREYTPGTRDKEEILSRFHEGQEYRCWYDPANPGVAILVRGLPWWTWLTFVVPGSFVLIGGGGFVYRLWNLGTSAERRSAISRRAASLELFDPSHADAVHFPAVPDTSLITDSPGTKLAYRLPIGASGVWMLVWLGVAAIGWNGVVSIFVVLAADSFRSGKPDWVLTLGILPFVLAGVALAAYFVRQIVVAGGTGPTLLEISDHPLLPGQRYQVYLAQAGQLRFRWFELHLVCDEEATYSQGTNARTEQCRVFQRRVLRREEFAVERGIPLELSCEVEIPARAMHSFRAARNEVRWSLVVLAQAEGWPLMERVFPVIVSPAAMQAGKPATSPCGNAETAADTPTTDTPAEVDSPEPVSDPPASVVRTANGEASGNGHGNGGAMRPRVRPPRTVSAGGSSAESEL